MSRTIQPTVIIPVAGGGEERTSRVEHAASRKRRAVVMERPGTWRIS